MLLPGARLGSALPPSSMEDPVSFRRLHPKGAYYIAQNVIQTPKGPRAQAVYSANTMREILASYPIKSPMTRYRFTADNVFRLPTRKERQAARVMLQAAAYQALKKK